MEESRNQCLYSVTIKIGVAGEDDLRAQGSKIWGEMA